MTSEKVCPALPLRMYDKAQTPVFGAAELRGLAGFFHATINPARVAVYAAPFREIVAIYHELAQNQWPVE